MHVVLSSLFRQQDVSNTLGQFSHDKEYIFYQQELVQCNEDEVPGTYVGACQVMVLKGVGKQTKENASVLDGNLYATKMHGGGGGGGGHLGTICIST